LINYNSGKDLHAFLEERGLGMRKKFGQNFLINSSDRSSLLDALELQKGDRIWEIGPGLGAMTKGLLERGGKVCAFEIDPAFTIILRELFPEELFPPAGDASSLRIVEGDVLKTWPKINTEESVPEEKLFLLGNLPYNVAAALLADFIEKGRFFKRMVVTVQREVAARMAAAPGSKDYSSFSVLCSSVYKITPLKVIKGSSFFPAPHIDSRGVRLDLVPQRKNMPRLFYPLVRSLFSSRRKTIKNTLSVYALELIMKQKGGGDRNPALNRELARNAVMEVLNRSGVSGERRPETLGIHEFIALAVFLEEFLNHE